MADIGRRETHLEANRRTKPSHLKLAQRIGVDIVTGRNEPGTVLPGEIDLAARFQVSRSVIREALRTLVAKGLVESRPKAGTKVRSRHDWNLLDPELLGWMFDGAPSLTFVRSLFELRLVFEPAAAELAAARRSPRQLSRMGHALEEMAVHGLSSEQGRAADQTFHAVLLEATDNELFVSLSASIAAAVRWTTFFKYRGTRHPRDPIPQHRALFAASLDADGPAARSATIDLVKQAELDTEAAMVAEERLAGGSSSSTTTRPASFRRARSEG